MEQYEQVWHCYHAKDWRNLRCGNIEQETEPLHERNNAFQSRLKNIKNQHFYNHYLKTWAWFNLRLASTKLTYYHLILLLYVSQSEIMDENDAIASAVFLLFAVLETPGDNDESRKL